MQRQIIMTISWKGKDLCSDLNKEKYDSDIRNEDEVLFYSCLFCLLTQACITSYLHQRNEESC